MSRANWSKEESDLLERIYKFKTANELQKIFPQYTNTQILRKAKRLGLKKDPLVVTESRRQNSIIQRQDLWSDEEINILLEWYPQEGALGVQERLPKYRKVSAIIHQANRRNLMRTQKDLIWKANSVDIDKENVFSVTIKYKGY